MFNATGLAATIRGEIVTAVAVDAAGNSSEVSNGVEASFSTPPTIVDESLLVTSLDPPEDDDHEPEFKGELDEEHEHDEEERTFGRETRVFDEGQELQLTGDFFEADPSVQVRIRWGDGNETDAEIVRSESFAASHIYLDDDPSASPSDEFGIFVTAIDADGSGSSLITVTINNVDPEIDAEETGA